MDLPIDHFRLLGVSPASDAQAVLRMLQQRLDRPPEQGFTKETLEARAELLRSSADLLSDPARRSAYEADLTALIRSDQPVQPALEIPSSREVAGLLLLLEAGQPLDCWDMAHGCLQPPQAPTLGSSREADLTLLAGLAALEAARDYRDERRFEQAARLLQEGLQLLQRMGQMPVLRESMHRELEDLTPYRVLDLLSRDLSCGAERQEGMTLLEQLVQRRGGLEGDADPHFPSAEFQVFFKQIRGFLTVQEQIDLFSRWAEAGSSTADFLASIALTASGFAQRKPERIAAARERLAGSGRPAVTPLLANLHLLLGQVDSAIALFEEGAAKDLRAWASRHSDDALGRLCAYCRDWLGRDVLPGYRDLDADADLDAYFSDRDVLAWVERDDRRSGRQFSAPSRLDAAPPADGAALPSDSGFGTDGSWSLPAIWGSDLGGEQPLPAAAAQTERGTEGSGARQRPRQAATLLAALPLPLRWGLPVAAVAVLLLVPLLWWRWRQAPAPGSSGVRPIPVVPASPPTAPKPAAPKPAAPAAVPPAPASGLPLTAVRPDERQLRTLLEAWLAAKASVLAGAELPERLEDLARPGPIDRLRSERRQDREAGQTQQIQVRVGPIRIVERSPRRLELIAELSYSDSRRAADGRVLERTPVTTLRNGYVFGRDGDTWRLAATYSGQ